MSMTAQEAYASLNAGIREAHRNTGRVETEEASILSGRRYDPSKEVQRPDVRLSLAGVSVATAGNISCLGGGEKTGKTQVLSGAIGSTYTTGNGDTLGMESYNPEHHAVIYLDCEMSEWDFAQTVSRSARMARQDNLPEWVYAYTLTGMAPSETWKALDEITSLAIEETGGIHLVLIDGYADLVKSPNDEQESFEAVRRLHAYSLEYNTAVLGVLHHNTGSDSHKMRGHIGSQAERKSETILTLEKDGDDASILYIKKARHAPLPKNKGVRIGWHDEAKRFVTLQSKLEEKASAQDEKNWQLIHATFQADPGLSHKELVDRLMEQTGSTRDASKKRLSRLRDAGYIKVQVGTGYYHKGDSRPC